MKGFFGGMFDFNGDGDTDFIEQAIGFMALEEMEDDAEEEYSGRRTVIVEEPDDWDEDEA